MKKHFWILIFFVVFASDLLSQFPQKGIITLQNSGKKAVEGAELSSLWAKPDISDNKGNFELNFQGKEAGYEALIKVKKAGFEVVNQKDLFHTLSVETSPLKLFMCKEGQWQENALNFYRISQESLTQAYAIKIEELNERLKSNQKALADSLFHYKEKYDRTLNLARTLSEKFATTNLDDVSDLYKNAILAFKDGNINASLEVLSEEKLEEQYNRINQEIKDGRDLISIGELKKVNGKEALKQGIEDYLLRADLLSIRFRFDEAYQAYRKAVEADTSWWYPRDAYASFLTYQGEYSKAIVQLQKARGLTRRRWELGVIDYGLAVAYAELEDYSTSIVFLEGIMESLENWKQVQSSQFDWFYLNIYSLLGNCYLMQNQFEKARKKLKVSQAISRELLNSSHTDPEIYLNAVFVSFQGLGKTYLRTSQFDSAIVYLNEGLSFARKLTARNEEVYGFAEAECLNSLAMAHLEERNFERAISLNKEAIPIKMRDYERIPKSNYLSLASSLANLGAAYIESHNYTEGAKSMMEAEAILEEFRHDVDYSSFNEGRLCIDMAMLFWRIFDEDKAIFYAQRGLRIFEWHLQKDPLRARPFLGRAKMTLGKIFTDQGNFPEAESLYLESVALLDSLNKNIESRGAFDRYLAMGHGDLGILYDRMSQYSKSIYHYNKAMDFIERNILSSARVYLPHKAKILQDKALVLSKMELIAQSEACHKESMAVYQRIESEVSYVPKSIYAKCLLGYAELKIQDIRDYQAGEELTKKALNILEEIGTTNPQAFRIDLIRANLLMALSFNGRNLIQDARLRIQTCLILIGQLSEKELAFNLGLVATVENRMANYSHKLRLFSEGRKYAESAALKYELLFQEGNCNFSWDAMINYKTLGSINQSWRAGKASLEAWQKADHVLKRCSNLELEKLTSYRRYYLVSGQDIRLDLRTYIMDSRIEQYNATHKNYFTYITKSKLSQLKQAKSLPDRIKRLEVIKGGFEKYFGKLYNGLGYLEAMADVYGNLAWLQLREGNIGAAGELVKKSIATDPQEPLAKLLQIHLMLVKGNPEMAVLAYQNREPNSYFIDTISWGEVILSDLAELESKGLIPKGRQKYLKQIRTYLSTQP
ncbi:MAG: tetratricopeptide repeat protein [Bacteroidia bacterium]|nr:tetratricopeptide repeat protein [Bacteroidia bacterium]